MLTDSFTQFHFLSETSNISLMLFILLIIGLLTTAISSYRYLFLFIFAGMANWLLIEILQAGLTQLLPLSSWHGYVLAMAISWLPMFSWTIYRMVRSKPNKRVSAYHLQQLHGLQPHAQFMDSDNCNTTANNHIEHTPVYKDYQPKFQ